MQINSGGEIIILS